MTTTMTRRPMAELSSIMDSQRGAIRDVAHPGTDLTRLFGLVRFALSQDRNLMSVITTREGQISVVKATTKLAQLGLEPTGRHGGAYLVKYGNTVQVLPDWRSLRQAAIDAGACSDAYARPVYESDAFGLSHDSGREVLTHTYDPFTDRGEKRGYYFCAITPGGPVYEFMTMASIAKRRAIGNSGTWSKWPEEMELKTVVRYGCDKRMSVRSRRMQDLLSMDDESQVGAESAAAPPIDVQTIDAPDDSVSAVERLKGKLQPAPAEVETVEVAPWKWACPTCGSSEFTRKAPRASKQGDSICSDESHESELRFFAAHSEALSSFREIVGACGQQELANVCEILSSRDIGEDESEWTFDQTKEAVAIALAEVAA